MKATGIVRKVDDLGRIVVPKEMRRSLSIEVGDPVEFYVDGDCIVVKKFDIAGDVEQVLDTLERSIQMKDSLLTPEQLSALNAKIEEMRAIAHIQQK